MDIDNNINKQQQQYSNISNSNNITNNNMIEHCQQHQHATIINYNDNKLYGKQTLSPLCKFLSKLLNYHDWKIGTRCVHVGSLHCLLKME
jgi:hypothetical protein